MNFPQSTSVEKIKQKEEKERGEALFSKKRNSLFWIVNNIDLISVEGQPLYEKLSTPKDVESPPSKGSFNSAHVIGVKSSLVSEPTMC
jgi:hypothetical protein